MEFLEELVLTTCRCLEIHFQSSGDGFSGEPFGDEVQKLHVPNGEVGAIGLESAIRLCAGGAIR